MAQAFAHSDTDAVDVSVIIVNFDGMGFLEACLDSLRAAFLGLSFEVVVVDNWSTDGSRDYLSSRSDIVYVASERNLGFGSGNNLGASRSRGRILLFLNNDTVVGSSLVPLVEEASRPGTGLVGCRLVYGDGRMQASVGYDHTPSRIVLSWLGLERQQALPSIMRRLNTDPAFYIRSHDGVDWVSGACFAVASELWKELAGFDTEFFMYCEDVDLGLRARNLGRRNVYLHDVLVRHFEGAGRPWPGERALQNTANSYRYFVCKHHGRAAAVLTCIALGSVFLARAVAFGVLATLLAPSARRSTCHDKCKAFGAVGLSLLVSATVTPRIHASTH